MLRNESLSDGVSNPAVSVSIGDATDGDRSPEDLLTETIKGFQAVGAENITQVPSEICGFPALMVNYTTPPDDQISKTSYVTAVSVMVPLGAKFWNIVALAQSTAPNNPTFMADAQVMLAGLRSRCRADPGGLGIARPGWISGQFFYRHPTTEVNCVCKGVAVGSNSFENEINWRCSEYSVASDMHCVRDPSRSIPNRELPA